MEKIRTIRLYKNEYKAELVRQLENNRIEGIKCLDQSSEKTLVLEGEESVIVKVMELMYCEDEAKIKEVFPSYITKDDEKKMKDEAYDATYEFLRGQLLRVINGLDGTGYHPLEGEKIEYIYKIWNEMNN